MTENDPGPEPMSDDELVDAILTACHALPHGDPGEAEERDAMTRPVVDALMARLTSRLAPERVPAQADALVEELLGTAEWLSAVADAFHGRVNGTGRTVA